MIEDVKSWQFRQFEGRYEVIIESCEMSSDEVILRCEACEICCTSGVCGVEKVSLREQYYCGMRVNKAVRDGNRKNIAGPVKGFV